MSPLLPVTDKCVFPGLQEAGVEYHAQSPPSLGNTSFCSVALALSLLWRLVGSWWL